MTEERYRLYKLILFAVLVVGTLLLGWQFSLMGWQMAENGRYVQLDRQKQRDILPSNSSSQVFPPAILDTRNGKIQDVQP